MSRDSDTRDDVDGGRVEEARASSEAHSSPNPDFEMTLDKEEAQTDDNWKATTQIKLILICLAIVSIVVALDATILVAALPVSDVVSTSVRRMGRKLIRYI